MFEADSLARWECLELRMQMAVSMEISPKNCTSDYHASAIADGLLARLQRAVERQLCVQVAEGVDSVRGTLTPRYPEDRYCGPNSAVRDVYRLDIALGLQGAEVGTYRENIRFGPNSEDITPQYRGGSMIVMTKAREESQRRLAEGVQRLCQSVLSEGLTTACCPRCGRAVQIMNVPSLFDVTCPQGCFTYNFHRDAETGQFLHGHVFYGKPGHSIEVD